MTNAERFDQHVQENMRQEREAIERRQRYLRTFVKPNSKGRAMRGSGSDTHDEWRKLNDAP